MYVYVYVIENTCIAGSNVVYGGQPVEHAISQQDSWTSILRFFKLHLPQHIASQELNHKL